MIQLILLFNLSGIETDSLWKDHFKRRFKHGTRSWKDYLNSHFKNGTSLFNDFISSGWRAQYFKRHFHFLLSYTAVNSKRNAEIAKSCLKGMAMFMTISRLLMHTVLLTKMFGNFLWCRRLVCFPLLDSY